MPVEYEIEAKGLEELQRKLGHFNPIYDKEVKSAMSSAVSGVRAYWKTTAPVLTGAYRASITGEVKQLVGGQIEGVIWTNQLSNKGFPYPAALEEGPQYHYRRTPRQGQQTLHHVGRVIKDKTESIMKLMGKACDAIVKELANAS